MGMIIDPYRFGVAGTGYGAVVTRASDATAQNYSAATAITFDTETYDSGGWHDTSSNTDRLTVPSGVSYVRLRGQIGLDFIGDDRTLSVFKNGAELTPACKRNDEDDVMPYAMQVLTPVLPVTPGDYFTLIFDSALDISVTVFAASTWFAIEKVN